MDYAVRWMARARSTRHVWGGVQPDEVFWKIFGRSRVAMLVLDDDGIYVDANPPACRLMGRAREEIVGRPLGFATASEHRAQLEQLWRRARRTGGLVTPWQFRGPDGSAINVDVVCTADTPGPGTHLTVSWQRPAVHARASRLSPRERQITRLVALGMSGGEIAAQLHLSPETVRTHVRNAMEGVAAHSRAQLVATALAEGLISLDGGA